MKTYKFQAFRGSVFTVLCGETSIPLVMGNSDCAQFLADWKAGATVVNDDGSPAPYSDAAARALGLSP